MLEDGYKLTSKGYKKKGVTIWFLRIWFNGFEYMSGKAAYVTDIEHLIVIPNFKREWIEFKYVVGFKWKRDGVLLFVFALIMLVLIITIGKLLGLLMYVASKH